ncbi:MAG: translation initiation factor IF-2 subunit alpha [Nanoarchaeota archaeon]|nr:translation initiation factor IF-2 subunit alpha [Nanoarchaeota archaeon]MBU1704574.1 translation initiation factor IF-2 subunit alpha [Nanoarchaeota archaeon]
MLLHRSGFPEENELVLCTINNIQHHSVFSKLDEYDRVGLIHISEVSPGRIRNIRDFVVEGKKVVCKVLRVDLEKGHIDLSLRRVNESQKKAKISEIKQEQKAEKILELVCKSLSLDVKKVYSDIMGKEKYHSLYHLFEDISFDRFDMSKLGIDKKLVESLVPIIKERIKPPEVEISGEFRLSSFDPDGVNVIKNALKKAQGGVIKFEGGGRYSLSIKSHDYKEAEKVLKATVDSVLEFMKKQKGNAEFIRKEKK